MALSNLSYNDTIEGKWNKNRYRIIKKLGEGGIGTVYKAINPGDNRVYALKFSEDNMSLNREYGILRKLEHVANVVKAYEIDDADINNKIYYFIAMEYINGDTLNNYRKRNKIGVAGALHITIILLKFMDEIHKEGYILGDTKLNNIMVNNKGGKIRFIDLGGAVETGSAIKEFTPAYDRAGWGCGYRISEPSYDLFSAVMVLTQLLLEIDINPRKQTLDRIKTRLNNKVADRALKTSITEILNGRKEDVKSFANTLLAIYNKRRIEEEIT
ncbi:MAG TPA: protein kinase, partial [Oscillospiraceae bacterium]|nr:protein kinase [Oscillospiraceae bacterium]